MKVFNHGPTAAAASQPLPTDDKLGPGPALTLPPWHRRHGILIATAALVAQVGIIVSGPGEQDTVPGVTAGRSTPRSASFSLIGTGWWTPDPTAPAAAAPPAQAPQVAAPPAGAPGTVPPPAAVPPPPPQPELVLRFDNPLTAVVSITNNANNPAVGCVIRIAPVAGPATMVTVPDVNFTVIGSAPTTVNLPPGPATGSTFHDTVTCDNGLSTSRDGTY